MVSVKTRQVYTNQTAYDQVDLVEADGVTRIVGVVPGDLGFTLFYNNVVVLWDLVSGSGVTDSMVKSGEAYWNQIPGAAGFYSFRFRPNALGYWRAVFSYADVPQVLALEYDVVADPKIVPTGLTTSFIK